MRTYIQGEFFASRINQDILKIVLLWEFEISIELRKKMQMTPQYLNKVIGYIKESILRWVHLTKLIMPLSITVSSQKYFGCFSPQQGVLCYRKITFPVDWPSMKYLEIKVNVVSLPV